MRWAHGYLALWLLCGSLVMKDLIPLYPNLTLPIPRFNAFFAVVAYVVSLAVLGAFLPGKIHEGTLLKDGTRLKYKCNGLLVSGVVITALASAHLNGYINGAWVANNYAELFVAANIFAFSLAIYLFVKGRLSRPRNWLRQRSFWDDFVMGAELNPFVLGVNIKFFSYRPSMSGWLVVNLSFLCKQYQLLGFITSRMLLYQLTTAWYIWDYFVHEPKILSTWDIIAEHFGLMLVWGDYVFVVFTFRYVSHSMTKEQQLPTPVFHTDISVFLRSAVSVQNFFLLTDTRPMSYAEVISICAVFCAGFAIFRGANSQKHQFKTQPQALIWGKPPITIGGRLLASGFWGVARHMNYTGDLLLALSFCLPCGTTSIVGYFYFIYLLLLTVHREKRDDERCATKYKSLWDDYCLQVPYRMVPFVY